MQRNNAVSREAADAVWPSAGQVSGGSVKFLSGEASPDTRILPSAVASKRREC